METINNFVYDNAWYWFLTIVFCLVADGVIKAVQIKKMRKQNKKDE